MFETNAEILSRNACGNRHNTIPALMDAGTDQSQVRGVIKKYQIIHLGFKKGSPSFNNCVSEVRTHFTKGGYLSWTLLKSAIGCHASGLNNNTPSCGICVLDGLSPESTALPVSKPSKPVSANENGNIQNTTENEACGWLAYVPWVRHFCD